MSVAIVKRKFSVTVVRKNWRVYDKYLNLNNVSYNMVKCDYKRDFKIWVVGITVLKVVLDNKFELPCFQNLGFHPGMAPFQLWMVMFNVFLSSSVVTFSIIEEKKVDKLALHGVGRCEDREVNGKYFDINIYQK